MSTSGERSRAIKNSDIVETEKTTLKNVHPVGVFAIYPPREIEKQLVEDFFEKAAVGHASHAPLDLVNAPGSPRMNGRIHIAKSPFVSRQLPVRMHVPLAEKKNELVLRKIGIDQRERDTVESEIPRGIPGILPLIWHGHDVIVVQMRPIVVATLQTFAWRRWASGIAIQPVTNIKVIELLGP